MVATMLDKLKTFESQFSGRLQICNETQYNIMRDNLGLLKQLPVACLLCAKHPYHKSLVGYEKNCDKDSPEYLFAYREDNQVLALNMVDAPQKEFFSDTMVKEGLNFIRKHLALNHLTVVVCNKGESRSATMVLLHMIREGIFEKSMSFEDISLEFLQYYPNWKPNTGILEYAKEYWNNYVKGEFLI